MQSGDPPVGLAARFALIIGGLCGLLGHYEAAERTAGPFVFLIRELLRRRLGRFEALVARFRAGTLRTVPTPDAPRPTLPSSAYARAWDPMPRERAWLWNLVPGVPAYIEQIECLLADAEMAALIAASPQAGRLLRPLWWMVSPDPLPAILRAPPRRRAPRPAPPLVTSASPAAGDAPPPQSAGSELSRVTRGRPREIRRFAPLPASGFGFSFSG